MAATWTLLKFECGGENFMETIHLRYQQNLGMSKEASGYKCVECGLYADTKYLIGRAEVEQKKLELRESTAALEELENENKPKPKVQETANRVPV